MNEIVYYQDIIDDLKRKFLEEEIDERIRVIVLDLLAELDEEGKAAIHELISNASITNQDTINHGWKLLQAKYLTKK